MLCDLHFMSSKALGKLNFISEHIKIRTRAKKKTALLLVKLYTFYRVHVIGHEISSG